MTGPIRVFPVPAVGVPGGEYELLIGGESGDDQDVLHPLLERCGRALYDAVLSSGYTDPVGVLLDLTFPEANHAAMLLAHRCGPERPVVTGAALDAWTLPTPAPLLVVLPAADVRAMLAEVAPQLVDHAFPLTIDLFQHAQRDARADQTLFVVGGRGWNIYGASFPADRLTVLRN
ncbi:MAG: hypothetical protein ACRC1K_23755 [Planctomycetia bacterium]